MNAQNLSSIQFHEDLMPMKKTIRDQGLSYSKVSGYLQQNSHILFGERMPRKTVLSWAIKTHNRDPKNFLKNIGFTK